MAEKLAKDALKKRIDYFKKLYPKAEKLFFTEDGACFLIKNMAENHAREMSLKVLTELVNVPEETDDEMTKAEAEVILKDLEINDGTDWELLKDLAKVFGWEVDRTKKTHLAVAASAKEELLKDNA